MDQKILSIEEMVDGVVVRKFEHKLTQEYKCGCEPCDCYLIPAEREQCNSECKCYEPTTGKDNCYCGPDQK